MSAATSSSASSAAERDGCGLLRRALLRRGPAARDGERPGIRRDGCASQVATHDQAVRMHPAPTGFGGVGDLAADGLLAADARVESEQAHGRSPSGWSIGDHSFYFQPYARQMICQTDDQETRPYGARTIRT